MKAKELALSLLFLILAGSCAHTSTDKDRASARIRYDIAMQYFSQNDLRATLRELLATVELDPELPQAQHALGLVYFSMGRYDEALAHYNRAVELKPNFSEALNNRGIVYIELGRYDEAIASFKLALSDILYAEPHTAEANMGWAYFKKQDIDQALKHLRNAVATNPKFCLGYSWLAQVELARGEGGQAVAYCRRFEKQCLDDENVRAKVPPGFVQEMKYYLGRAYQATGDVIGARDAFTACAKSGLDNDLGTRCDRSLTELQ